MAWPRRWSPPGRRFGLAFAGAIMLATLSITFTNMADASTVLAPAEKDRRFTEEAWARNPLFRERRVFRRQALTVDRSGSTGRCSCPDYSGC